ncbi:2-(1,2-epoxy-1,2-dihydrophenyl)acetyl-CoA isomerase PaaG [Nevskia sp.]|uniref:2-(1,2-epoxy-1,2-dihydrophenyl)acetyl-CoA isomerase PaaG n=1 Tax=Nevskia sp. TaxID=1929292 RepID=UPI003F6F140C
MHYDHILYSLDAGIARITLNRPDRLNSFTAAMHGELRDAISRVAADDRARVLLLTGAGRGFCAGQDLSDRAVSADAAPVDLGHTVETLWAPLVLSLRRLPKPVVVAVNGVAAGAGANIALAGDIVVATRSASFIQSFCKLGLIPDTGGTWALPRLLGTARAMGLAMLGDKLSASQAADWGLIWKAVDDDAFSAEIEALLLQLSTAPTFGLAKTKELILGSGTLSLADALEREAQAMRACGYSADYREGVAAFLQKRPASFTGR